MRGVGTQNLRRNMTAICDTSMPRTTLNTERNRAVYWWIPDMAELGTRCVQARRRYQRARRRRRHDEKEISMRYRAYRTLRCTLQEEIKIAKDRAWSDLVQVIESVPWGRPYRTVTRKLCAKGPLATMEMEPALLAEVIVTPPPQRGHRSGTGGSLR